MKKRSYLKRLLAIGAATGMLASMLVPAGPAFAKSQSWGVAGDVDEPVGFGITLGRMAVANDGDIFAIADGTDAGSVMDDLARSTNGGSSWTVVDNAIAVGTVITDVVASPTYGQDQTVFISGGTSVARSQDSGATFTVIAAGVAAGTILDLAVAPDFSKHKGQIAVAYVGVAVGGVARATCTEATCAAWTVIPWAVVTNEATEGALAIEFAPNYLSNGVLIAIGTSGATNEIGNATTSVFEIRSTSGAAFATPVTVVDGAAVGTSARIAFPDDYAVSTNDTYFVGTDTSVYRRAQGSWTDTTPVSSAAAPATSLVVSGNFATSVLMVGLTTAASNGSSQVALSNDGGITWVQQAINLGGSAGVVNLINSVSFDTDSTVYASTTGLNGGFWYSKTGGKNSLSWTAKGAFADNYTTIGALAGAPGDSTPLFAVYGGAVAGSGALFRSTQAEPTSKTKWTKVGWLPGATSANNVTSVGVSQEFDTDDVVYLGGGTTIAKSTNGGLSFSSAAINAIPSGTLNAGGTSGGRALAVANASTLFALASDKGQVHKTADSGSTWTTTTITGTPALSDVVLSPAYATDSTLLVAARTPGGAAEVWISTDAGVTYTLLKSHDSSTGSGRGSIAFDNDYATNSTIYATTDTDVYRWVVDTSTSWLRLRAGSHNVGAIPDDPLTGDSGLTNVAVANGVLYVSDNTAGSVIRRSLNPRAAFDSKATQWFDLGWVAQGGITTGQAGTGLAQTGTAATTATAALNSVGMLVTPSGTDANLIVLVDTSTTPDNIISYTDNMLISPVTTSPSDGSSKTSAPTLKWAPYSKLTTAGFTVRLSTDATFTDVIDTSYTNFDANVHTAKHGTAITVPSFSAGKTYYWQVRANDTNAPVGGNISSPWSPVQSYIASSGLPSLTYPTSQHSVDTLTPGLTWTAVSKATDYRVQLATNPSVTGSGDSYVNPTLTRTVGSATPALQLSSDDLVAGTTYYWQVQAVFGTATGEYSNASAALGASGVFRTPTTAVAGGVPSGPIAASTALAAAEATGLIELVSGFNYSSGLYDAYVPGLAGNKLTTISPNTVILVTVTQDTTLVVSGIEYAVKAGTPTPIGVQASVSITVKS